MSEIDTIDASLRDNRDSSSAMKFESLAEAANFIRKNLNTLNDKKDDLKIQIGDVCTKSFDLARVIEWTHSTLGGKRFSEWWREMEFEIGDAARYLRLARTAGRNTLGDKDQLRLIGILPEPETHNDQQSRREGNPFAWVKQVGKINAAINIKTVEGMGDVDRMTAMAHLKPIAEVYRALEALSK